MRPMGASISLDGKGESCLFEGRGLDLDPGPGRRERPIGRKPVEGTRVV